MATVVAATFMRWLHRNVCFANFDASRFFYRAARKTKPFRSSDAMRTRSKKYIMHPFLKRVFHTQTVLGFWGSRFVRLDARSTTRTARSLEA